MTGNIPPLLNVFIYYVVSTLATYPQYYDTFLLAHKVNSEWFNDNRSYSESRSHINRIKNFMFRNIAKIYESKKCLKELTTVQQYCFSLHKLVY